jgi:hypothetical protein
VLISTSNRDDSARNNLFRKIRAVVSAVAQLATVIILESGVNSAEFC